MAHYEILWDAYGIAVVEADSPEEAAKIAESEIKGFGRMGELASNQIDGFGLGGVDEISEQTARITYGTAAELQRT